MKEDRDDDAITVLSKLRRLPRDSPVLLTEYVAIRSEVMFEQQFVRDNYPGITGIRLQARQVSTRDPNVKFTCRVTDDF